MGVSETIKRVADGAGVLATVAEGRLMEALDELHQGNFERCSTRVAEAGAKLRPLVLAEQQIAAFERGTQIIRGREIQPGMTLTGHGRVMAVEFETDDLVKVEVENGHPDHPLQLGGDHEVAISVGHS